MLLQLHPGSHLRGNLAFQACCEQREAQCVVYRSFVCQSSAASCALRLHPLKVARTAAVLASGMPRSFGLLIPPESCLISTLRTPRAPGRNYSGALPRHDFPVGVS